MRALQNLGTAQRLGAIVVSGAIALGGLAAITLSSQGTLSSQAEDVRRLEACGAALNHLNNRQSELKVDAYRAALGQDVSQDVVDDVQSAVEAGDAVESCGMPTELLTEFQGYRTDFDTFNTFITQFVNDGVANPRSVLGKIDQIPEQNDKTDGELDVLTEKVQAGIAQQKAEMDTAVSSTRMWAILIAGLGLALLVGMAIPLVRSILGPIRQLAEVIGALDKGDLTVRSGITSRDELGKMATGLDRSLDKLRESMRTIAHDADSLASASTELAAVSGEIASAADNTDRQSNSASAEADEISRNVQTVAAGSEEMGLSIREISRNAAEAAQVASIAVSEAASATETIRKLG
ncbi:MAG TPA: methyl-accepting chemotaxis protein, partial [Actinoplanes sp.]|nr:methyl-accepting chemotaxis protein [Actinoplanes sp.]